MPSSMSKEEPAFASEGFDLDAVATSSGGAQDVVYEIGGGVTNTAHASTQHNDNSATSSSTRGTTAAATSKEEEKISEPLNTQKDDNKDKKQDDVLEQANECKSQGNASFAKQDWLEAYDWYSKAIIATPGMTGTELLELRDAWQKEQEHKVRQQLAQEDQARREKYEREREEQRRRRAAQNKGGSAADDTNKNDDSDTKETKVTTNAEKQDDTKKKKAETPTFRAPPHVHGTTLSVFYANRAATLLKLQRYDEAVADADVAILWNPLYSKAYLRRSAAHEQLDDIEAALRDAKQALMIVKATTSTVNMTPAQHRNVKHVEAEVARLQKMQDARLEQLKEETMGKLKDLGNSILGNFGLSLDNFQANQDPNTGSYSIAFNQNTNK